MSIAERIRQACATTAPGKARNEALKAIRWVLATDDERYGALVAEECVLTPFIHQAQIFDGRDNETVKAAFWSKQLGVKLTPSLL